jgi:ParB/RepB/Spo0J family partition protein
MELTPIELGQVVNIPLAQIEPDPEQPRRHFDDEALDALALDIKARGVQEPIKIRKAVIPGDPYIIKTGERRYQASKRAGRRQIPCILAAPEALDGKGRSIERLFDQIKENELREPLSALDWAYSFRRMRERYGMKVNEIAEACAARGLKFSRPHVSNIMRLAELPDWAQTALRDRRLTAGHGKVLFAALDSPKVAEEIQAIIDDTERPEPPSVRELQHAILEAYHTHHRQPWQVSYNTDYADLLQQPKDIGVIELANPNSGKSERFIVDQERFDAAVAARTEELEHKADGRPDDDEEPERDSSENALEADERAPFLNPRWDKAGKLNQYARRNGIFASARAWLVSEVGARLDETDRIRLGAWMAYLLASRDDDGGATHLHEESMWSYETSIADDPPPGLPLSWQDWRRVEGQQVLAQLEAAGARLIRAAEIDLLLEIADGPRPDINDYRCNADWFESLDREELDLALDRLSDVVPPASIPDDFEARVALLAEHAELFGVPDAIVDAWAELNAEQSA